MPNIAPSQKTSLNVTANSEVLDTLLQQVLLGYTFRSINIGSKIDGLALKIYRMIIAGFSLQEKLRKI